MIGQPLKGHSGAIYTIAFSPDGKTLASAGDDGTIILWDVAAQKLLREPIPGHGAVYSLAFSPDGRTLASGNLDGSINLWGTTEFEAIGQPLTGHGDWVSSLAFSPDGRTLASGSNDGTIILWDMDPKDWIAQSCQRVGRNFTPAEWAQYFSGEEYRRTCDQWPLGSEALPTAVVVPGNGIVPTPGVTATPEVTATAAPSTFTEDFNSNMDAWSSMMTSGTARQVKTDLASGNFRVQLSPGGDNLPWAYWINNTSTYSDVEVEAVVTNNGNNANGVSLVCQYNDYGWYEFWISNAGLYTIYAFDKSLPPMQGHVALATGGSSAIKSGKAANTYTAVCKGDQLSLSINGTPINTVTDRLYNFSEGKIGMGVSSPLKLPVDVQFESVSVSIPQ